jgi:hypothetical protein
VRPGAARDTRHSGIRPAGYEDRRNTLRLEATRTLWKQAQVYLRYERERNRSPVEVNEYDRDWIAVSLEFWR